MNISVSAETENIKCQACDTLFTEAKPATIHLKGVLGEDVHYCAEHFIERYPNYHYHVSLSQPPAQDDAEYRKRYAARLLRHGYSETDAKASADAAEIDLSDMEPEDHADDEASYARG